MFSMIKIIFNNSDEKCQFMYLHPIHFTLIFLSFSFLWCSRLKAVWSRYIKSNTLIVSGPFTQHWHVRFAHTKKALFQLSRKNVGYVFQNPWWFFSDTWFISTDLKAVWASTVSFSEAGSLYRSNCWLEPRAVICCSSATRNIDHSPDPLDVRLLAVRCCSASLSLLIGRVKKHHRLTFKCWFSRALDSFSTAGESINQSTPSVWLHSLFVPVSVIQIFRLCHVVFSLSVKYW